jgi:hypothetical protein
MDGKKFVLLMINLAGGTAVLVSYALGLAVHPDSAEVLWGGVPENLRFVYTLGMGLAAVGYFAFSYFILFRLNPGETKVAGRYGYGLFLALYALILFPSALWMPLTFPAAEQGNQALAWLVRLVLFLVALGSLGLLLALLKVKPRQPKWAHNMALTGSVFFCFQTVLMDFMLWGLMFKA